MDIFELAATLPNGFHDAEIRTLVISYEKQSIQIECDIWIGSMNDPPELREAYRAALVELHGVQYCIMDRPDPRYPFSQGLALMVDLYEPDPAVELAGEGHAFRFWVGEWNGSVHIRATSASLTWQGEVQYRTDDF